MLGVLFVLLATTLLPVCSPVFGSDEAAAPAAPASPLRPSEGARP